jgi:hypothetical protein
MSEIPEAGLETPITEVVTRAAALKEDVAALLREITPDHVRATVTAEMVKFDAAYSTALAPNTLAAMRSEHESTCGCRRINGCVRKRPTLKPDMQASCGACRRS